MEGDGAWLPEERTIVRGFDGEAAAAAHEMKVFGAYCYEMAFPNIGNPGDTLIFVQSGRPPGCTGTSSKVSMRHPTS